MKWWADWLADNPRDHARCPGLTRGSCENSQGQCASEREYDEVIDPVVVKSRFDLSGRPSYLNLRTAALTFRTIANHSTMPQVPFHT
jgi:hypothetical protein